MAHVQSTCSHCHGLDGAGSTIAPALADGMRGQDDFETFETIVMEGVEGEQSVMDGFADDPNVNDRVGDIYKYLTARIAGDLPGGRPQKLEE